MTDYSVCVCSVYNMEKGGKVAFKIQGNPGKQIMYTLAVFPPELGPDIVTSLPNCIW